jgi:hypothetical protein
MPPMGSRLSDSDFRELKQWIADGAPWPETPVAAPPIAGSKKIVTQEQLAFWSFRPLAKVSLPEVKDRSIGNDETDRGKLIKFLQDPHPDSGQWRQIDLLEKVNREPMQQESEATPELEASIRSMEVAFRMPTEAPDVFDISKEPEKGPVTLRRQRIRTGLPALRLVEKGVRVGPGVLWQQQYMGSPHRHHGATNAWPGIPMDRWSRCWRIQGREDLLDETLVLLGMQFGRTAVVHTGGAAAVQAGRDHNTQCITVLLAGGGTKTGQVYGVTDDFGLRLSRTLCTSMTSRPPCCTPWVRPRAPDIPLQRSGLPPHRRPRTSGKGTPGLSPPLSRPSMQADSLPF